MAAKPGRQYPSEGLCAVLGAGSLGRLWAARLSPDTTGFVPRFGQGSIATSLTYQFQQTGGQWLLVERPWLTELDGISLLLVTTKAGDTLNALEPILGCIPDQCPVVLFQNGLGSQQAVAERWPNRPILAASTTEAANRPAPDQLVHAAAGQTRVGALTPGAEPLVESVVEHLSRSGLNVEADPDILARLWSKLVVNAGINPFTALLDCTNGNLSGQPLFDDNIDQLCEELYRLMLAEGLDAPSPADLRQRIESVARATARNTSSMRGDVLNRRATEIDYINGYVARRARERNLPAPVNQMLTDRVKALVPHPNPERSS